MSLSECGKSDILTRSQGLSPVSTTAGQTIVSDGLTPLEGHHLQLITAAQAGSCHLSADDLKNAIYRHPLFPLMALVFEKCERASSWLDGPTERECDGDIRAFVHLGQQSQQAFHTDNTELDAVMINAIQVFRIHLLELTKVRELCHDFCQRYTACLKGKLQSEHLLQMEDDIDSPPSSPAPLHPVTAGVVGGGVVVQPAVTVATISQGQIITGNMVYQMVNTAHGIVAQPVQVSLGTTPVVHESRPLSHVSLHKEPVANQLPVVTPASLSWDSTVVDHGDGVERQSISKRGVLPKQATQIMKSWLFQHLVHPYPTEDEKRQIASQTNLTMLQVNNWFINARRRILLPMLDNCGGDGGGGDKSKRKLVSRPTQRFWPEAIASIQPRLPSMQLTMTPSSPEHISPPPPDVAQSTVTASFSDIKRDGT